MKVIAQSRTFSSPVKTQNTPPSKQSRNELVPIRSEPALLTLRRSRHFISRPRNAIEDSEYSIKDRGGPKYHRLLFDDSPATRHRRHHLGIPRKFRLFCALVVAQQAPLSDLKSALCERLDYFYKDANAQFINT